jgi:hypothetical protein
VEQVTIKTYDPSKVQITIGAPLDEHGNPVVIPGAENFFPVTIKPGGVGSFTIDLQPKYPLYCIDRGDHVDPENQYVGPFTTHDDAHEKLEHDGDVVRRCRQLRPSEIAFDRDNASLDRFETFSSLVDELDEAATSGNLPEGAWHRDGRVVIGKYNDGSGPNERNYDTWVDDHTSVDAFICEGDE